MSYIRDFTVNGAVTWRGWMLDTNLETWMLVRCGMDGGETQNSRPGWKWLNWDEMWYAIHGTWIEVRRDLNEGETPILGPRWTWDGTKMKVRLKSRDLGGCYVGPGFRLDSHLETWVVWDSTGWGWDAYLEARVWGKLWLEWNCDAIFVTWMEARHEYPDLGGHIKIITWTNLKSDLCSHMTSPCNNGGPFTCDSLNA